MKFLKQIKKCIPILLTLFLAGCFALPEEAPALPPPTIAVPTIPPIPTAPVARGNVQMTATPQATYVPVREERLYFLVTGVLIEGIFVSAGDEVRAGDVVAALYMPEVVAELEDLLRLQDETQLRLRQVNERRNLALSLAETSGIPVDDTNFLESRANIQAELRLLEMDIDYLRDRYESRFLRATMDGVVGSVATFVVNMRSMSRHTIAVIADHNYTAFIVTTRAAEFMHPGEYFTMTLRGNTFLMQVICPDEAGFERSTVRRYEAFLAFVDSPPALTGGDRGQVHVLFDEVFDVLYIPTPALRRVGHFRTFVYVMENGLRTVREVEVGLEGDRHVEIISGLAEGELVVTR